MPPSPSPLLPSTGVNEGYEQVSATSIELKFKLQLDNWLPGTLDTASSYYAGEYGIMYTGLDAGTNVTAAAGMGDFSAGQVGGVSPADDIHHLYFGGCYPTQTGVAGPCPGLIPALLMKLPHCKFGVDSVPGECLVKLNIDSVTSVQTCSDTASDCSEFAWSDDTQTNPMCINDPCTPAQAAWNAAKLAEVGGGGISAMPEVVTTINSTTCARKAACAQTCDWCHASLLDVTVNIRVFDDDNNYAPATVNDVEYFVRQSSYGNAAGALQLIRTDADAANHLYMAEINFMPPFDTNNMPKTADFNNSMVPTYMPTDVSYTVSTVTAARMGTVYPSPPPSPPPPPGARPHLPIVPGPSRGGRPPVAVSSMTIVMRPPGNDSERGGTLSRRRRVPRGLSMTRSSSCCAIATPTSCLPLATRTR